VGAPAGIGARRSRRFIIRFPGRVRFKRMRCSVSTLKRRERRAPMLSMLHRSIPGEGLVQKDALLSEDIDAA